MHPASPNNDVPATSSIIKPESCSMRFLERRRRPPKGSSRMQNATAESPARRFFSRSRPALVVCAGTWTLRETLVVPLPAEIVCGENVAVDPVGRPEAVKVMAGNVVPAAGLTLNV